MTPIHPLMHDVIIVQSQIAAILCYGGILINFSNILNYNQYLISAKTGKGGLLILTYKLYVTILTFTATELR